MSKSNLIKKSIPFCFIIVCASACSGSNDATSLLKSAHSLDIEPRVRVVSPLIIDNGGIIPALDSSNSVTRRGGVDS